MFHAYKGISDFKTVGSIQFRRSDVRWSESKLSDRYLIDAEPNICVLLEWYCVIQDNQFLYGDCWDKASETIIHGDP